MLKAFTQPCLASHCLIGGLIIKPIDIRALKFESPHEPSLTASLWAYYIVVLTLETEWAENGYVSAAKVT